MYLTGKNRDIGDFNTRKCWLFSAYGMTGEVKWLYPGADKDTLVNIALYFLYL